ncbi:MAG: hypothetical protein HYW25_02445 [Candidatus Aenigmarchaeota archaeon]|nr:hypothetical protein [Candidatus Aenigmarchaeota archaeon]
MNIPEIDIKSKLKEISEMGFIKALRKSDTGIGFTLETEMGIKENNLKNEDFTYKGEKVELKTQRKGTTSNITLFTKEPVKGELNDKKLIDKYGYKNGHGRRALKITLTTRYYTPQGLKLEIDENSKNIFVTHKTDGKLWYWTVSDIKFKLGNLLLVFAAKKRKGESEYFHYNEAYYFTNFDEETFFKLIQTARIVVDLRMHLRPTGTVRNHGTAFRIINLENLTSCYKKKETIVSENKSFRFSEGPQ